MTGKIRFWGILFVTAFFCVLISGCANVIYKPEANLINDNSKKWAYDNFSDTFKGILDVDQDYKNTDFSVTNLDISSEGITFEESPWPDKGKAETVSLKFIDLGDPTVINYQGDMGGFVYVVVQNSANSGKFYFYFWMYGSGKGRYGNTGDAVNVATVFADSLYVLIHDPQSREYSPEKQAFRKTAEEYLLNPAKYKLRKKAGKYFEQAEEAAKNKDYSGAAELYSKGLKAAPWYPKGHYDLAVLLGEQQSDYEGAVDEMNKYLEVSPDAQDAPAAQDKIYEWEIKAEKGAAK